jgi:hypothetical protein
LDFLNKDSLPDSNGFQFEIILQYIQGSLTTVSGCFKVLINGLLLIPSSMALKLHGRQRTLNLSALLKFHFVILVSVLQQQKKAAQSSSSCRHINQLNVFY